MTCDEKEPGFDGAFGLRQSKVDVSVNTIDVSSVDETVKKIEENGGEIVRSKQTLPGVGYLAYFKDTEGNLWGIMFIVFAVLCFVLSYREIKRS